MVTLTERRIEQVVNQAQLSLYVHERDISYTEILELVDEMMDLLVEVRRDRAALEEIADRWEESVAAARAGTEGGELALQMCALARRALQLPTERVEPLPSP